MAHVVDSDNPVPITGTVTTVASTLDARFAVYEDSSFVTGESPRTLDINTDLSRNAKALTFINDGAGDILIAVSNDGATFSDNWTVRAQETFEMSEIEIDKVRLTWVSNSSYRLQVI